MTQTLDFATSEETLPKEESTDRLDDRDLSVKIRIAFNAFHTGKTINGGKPEAFMLEVIKEYASSQRKAAEIEGRIAENDYHWHRQKAIEKQAKTGISGYFLDRKSELQAQKEAMK